MPSLRTHHDNPCKREDVLYTVSRVGWTLPGNCYIANRRTASSIPSNLRCLALRRPERPRTPKTEIKLRSTVAQCLQSCPTLSLTSLPYSHSFGSCFLTETGTVAGHHSIQCHLSLSPQIFASNLDANNVSNAVWMTLVVPISLTYLPPCVRQLNLIS